MTSALALIVALVVSLSTGARADCLIAGDSIAVGLGEAMRECRTDAKIGISSAAVVARVSPATWVIVSAGSNDPHNPRLADNLRSMHQRAPAAHLIFIIPINPTAAAANYAVARRYGAATVTFAPARDNVHPRAYGPIAAQVRAIITAGR
jgi:hypothetical protein